MFWNRKKAPLLPKPAATAAPAALVGPAAPVAALAPDARPADPIASEPAAAASSGAAAYATLRSSLGSDASISGKLSFTKATRIDGTLKGEVRSTDLLVIGETAFVDGQIYADTLIVLGRAAGEVKGTDRVEILPNASFRGAIEAHYLIVSEGAFLEGDCKINPPARAVARPPKRDDEPVGTVG